MWQGYHSRGGLAFEMTLDLYSRDWLSLRDDFPDALPVVAGDFNQSLAEHHYYASNRQRGLLETALGHVGLIAVTTGDGDPVARDLALRGAGRVGRLRSRTSSAYRLCQGGATLCVPSFAGDPVPFACLVGEKRSETE